MHRQASELYDGQRLTNFQILSDFFRFFHIRFRFLLVYQFFRTLLDFFRWSRSDFLFKILSNYFSFLQINSGSLRFFQISLFDSIKFPEMPSNTFKFFPVRSDSIRFPRIVSYCFRLLKIASDSCKLFQTVSNSFK